LEIQNDDKKQLMYDESPGIEKNTGDVCRLREVEI
jgi:hypothetical protein